jgi:hypothetical protein
MKYAVTAVFDKNLTAFLTARHIMMIQGALAVAIP